MKTTSSEHQENILCTQIVFCFDIQNKFMYTTLTCSELGIFIYWTCNSMNNLLSYCGLVDARINASEKDLPVIPLPFWHFITIPSTTDKWHWTVFLEILFYIIQAVVSTVDQFTNFPNLQLFVVYWFSHAHVCSVFAWGWRQVATNENCTERKRYSSLQEGFVRNISL